MAHNISKHCQSGALRTALGQAHDGPSPEQTAIALQRLAPHIGNAARRLQQKQIERRSVRLQALALAGCGILFAGLAWFGWQNRAFLLASPQRWGVLLIFGLLALVVAGCLPVLGRKTEGVE